MVDNKFKRKDEIPLSRYNRVTPPKTPKKTSTRPSREASPALARKPYNLPPITPSSVEELSAEQIHKINDLSISIASIL